MASAHTLKRSYASLSPTPASSFPAPSAKRPARGPATLDALLRTSSSLDPALYAARRAFLSSTRAPDAVFERLLAHLPPPALLRVIDANLSLAGVVDVVSRGDERLCDMGVRSHGFVVGETGGVVASFAGAYGSVGGGVLKDVVAFVAREVLGESQVGITVLCGGGVRNVLLGEFARVYKAGAGLSAVLVTAGDRAFMIPYEC